MRKFVLIFLFGTFALSHAQLDSYQVDALVTPKKQLTVLTVGGPAADISGFSSKAIQMAIEALPEEGGTIKLTPGLFLISAPVSAVSNMKLIGSGPETVLKIIDGVRSPFIVDADYGELKVTVEDADGFNPGMALQIVDDRWNGCWDVSTARITDIVDNTLYFDKHLIRDYRSDFGGIASNATSAVEAVNVENVTFAHFVVDGNREKSARMDGCNGAAVFAKMAKNILIEDIIIKGFNGEGISWQITENVTVRGCDISRCTNIGLHPGSGSPNTVIEDTKSHHNDVDGLFICWRVSHSQVRRNSFYENGRHGICTGHKDTDVIFEDNHIYSNGSAGVNFRGERAANAPHRNTFFKNIIENNGVKNGGYGFSFNSPAEDVILKNNIIRDTQSGAQKAAVKINENGLPVQMIDNKISGHPDGDIIFEKEQK